MTGTGDFGVYLHWPFCAAKCPYCDFNSHVRHGQVDQERFAAAFERELAHMRQISGPRLVTSIFLGGGTPSLMTPDTVKTLIDAVADAWTLDGNAEITLEANPSSVEATRFRGYAKAGVNRLSLGVQALNDEALRQLGRLHDVRQALEALQLAADLFPRYSFDLIYARPDQSLTDWEKELAEALRYAGDHMSLYQLTIEEGTPYFARHAKGQLVVPDPDEAARHYELTQDIMAAAGLPAYEISNHARPGQESRHNLTYWRGEDYAGVGPGAHGRLRQGEDRLAIATERHPETWLEQVEREGHGIVTREHLDPEHQADEFLMMGLRLADGIDLARFEAVRGRPIDPDYVRFLKQEGLLEPTGPGRLRASSRGRLVLNTLVAELAA